MHIKLNDSAFDTLFIAGKEKDTEYRCMNGFDIEDTMGTRFTYGRMCRANPDRKTVLGAVFTFSSRKITTSEANH